MATYNYIEIHNAMAEFFGNPEMIKTEEKITSGRKYSVYKRAVRDNLTVSYKILVAIARDDKSSKIASLPIGTMVPLSAIPWNFFQTGILPPDMDDVDKLYESLDPIAIEYAEQSPLRLRMYITEPSSDERDADRYYTDELICDIYVSGTTRKFNTLAAALQDFHCMVLAKDE